MTNSDGGVDAHPSAFITYAQSHPDWDGRTTEQWKSTVLDFAMLLCELGVDADIDQFHGHDLDVDWNRFGPNGIRDSEFVILVVSTAYRERWEATNTPTTGAGAVREINELLGMFNHDQGEFRRRVLIAVLPGASDADVPHELNGFKRFKIDALTEVGIEDLYRTITNQPATPKPSLGVIRELPPIADRSSSSRNARKRAEAAELETAISRVEDAIQKIPGDVMDQARRGNFSLPWVRAAAQMDAEHQALLARRESLEASETSDAEGAVTEQGVIAAIETVARTQEQGTELSYVEVARELGVSPNDPDYQRYLQRAATVGLIESTAEVDQLEGPLRFRLIRA
jgi:hypothetical protein